MAAIVLKNVTKRFGDVTAVDKLNLKIEDGSFGTLLGPSGCGKTTTLRMIAGLEVPSDEGEIWIGDTCVYSAEKGLWVSPGDRKLGLVFQSYALWPHMTVFENIAFGLRIAHVSRKQVAERVDHIASVLFIGELLERYPSELSGGQQQRVAIARVLVMEPSVLLLDEPLSNLDAKLRMDMRAELKRLHLETKSTIVYVTHDQLEALTMSTHVAVMHQGRLQQWAGPMDVYHEPGNVFTADFIGNPRINLIDGVMSEAHDGVVTIRTDVFTATATRDVTGADGKSPSATSRAGETVRVGVRAEDFIVSHEPRDGFAEGSVYSVLPAGSEWYLKIKVAEQLLTATVYEDPAVTVDETIWIGIKPGRMKVFDANEERVSLSTGA